MALKIDSLNPSPVKVGWEGSLTIYGRDLGDTGFVSIDGKDPKVESWAAAQIVVKVTKEMTASPGKKRLVVHDKGGGFDEAQWEVQK